MRPASLLTSKTGHRLQESLKRRVPSAQILVFEEPACSNDPRPDNGPTVLREKLRTLGWYLRRPRLYRELGRRIVRAQVTTPRLQQKLDADKTKGKQWCAERVQDEASLLKALGLDPKPASLSEHHPELWQAAHAAVDACPVKMGGPADVDLLYNLVRHLPAVRVLETGVANGWSSLAVLAAMEDRGRGELVSTDMPYAKMNNEAWVGCAVQESLRHRWTLYRLPDRDGLPKALKKLGSLDLAHHDSDKSYGGRMYVYEACWPAIRAGGALLSDDIEDNFAFRDFAKRVGRTPYVFSKAKAGNYAGALIK